MSKLKGASATRGDLMGPFLGNLSVAMGSYEIPIFLCVNQIQNINEIFKTMVPRYVLGLQML